MTNKKQNKAKDGFCWLMFWCLVAATVALNIKYPGVSLPIKILSGLLLLSIATFIAYLTVQGKYYAALLSASYYEINKVTWPSRKETATSAIMVGVVIAIVSVVLWLFDSFFMFLLNKLIH